MDWSECWEVKEMVLSLALRCCTKAPRVSGVSSSKTRISSIYLNHTRGWVPCQASRASRYTFSMKRLASVGATGVPMATPLICQKCLAAYSKVLPWRMCNRICRSISFIR